MPYTGFDPYGPEPDPSGGGLDPSFYYATSPGGRFPGDEQNYLEYLAAQSRGDAGANPDYEAGKGWNALTKLPGNYGKFLNWLKNAHTKNVTTGGEGQSPDLHGGYPYQFWSGPGASYGPSGGPLHGLVDQGRPGDNWDGPDRPEYVPQDIGPEKKKKGGGDGGGAKFNLQPYQGITHKSSFVDWQPTQPFAGQSGPTRFVPGQGSSTPATPPSAVAPGAVGSGGKAGKGGGTSGGAGGGKGKGGAGEGGGNTTPGGGKAGGAKDQQPQDPLSYLLDILMGKGNTNRFATPPGPGLRDAIGGGVNTNNLDKGTPGWLSDPTGGVHNTSGFPGPTPFGPDANESFDGYLTRLHDAGFDSGSIGSMLGPYGYKQNDAGGWEWGWGTGPVVRGDAGYQFANQGPTAEVTVGQQGGGTPWYHQGTQGGGGLGGGGGLAGGAGNQGPAGGQTRTGADYITGGVFSLPAY